ncbi:MAG: UDP-glucose 4-epimerase GalE [Eubacteriales bacterium]|nr:UDP-glucose 4-epimerase GalE [Eubacteriales bacterium]
MRVLVTGGAGYVGSHTCLALLRGGHEVIVVDDLRNASIEALKRVQRLAGRALTFHQFDMRDGERLDKVFAEGPIDCAIHFAALKAVGESVEKPLEYYENNLLSTLTLCRSMLRFGVSRLIFSSSATVYAPLSPMPVDEDAPLGCANPYGWTKLMCEQILRDVAHANPSFSCVLLRYFNPIGADSSGEIGEDPNGVPNNLMPFITQVALEKFKQLQVYGDDYDTLDGTGVRDYIHVSDLARGHLAAMDYAMGHTGCVAINLGTGRGYSVLDIIQAFESVNGVQVPYVIGPRRPGDMAIVYANTQRARELLGWETELNIEDMCRDAWRWQKRNPAGYGDK